VGMHKYLLCTILVMVVSAYDPKVLFVECVTVFTAQSTWQIWVGLVD
jgi:hypothetical protein